MKKLFCACLATMAGATAFAADPKPDEKEKPPARPAFTAASRAAVKVEDKKERKVSDAGRQEAGRFASRQGGSGPVSPGPRE